MALGEWVVAWHAWDGGVVVAGRAFDDGWEFNDRTHDGHAHEWEHILWACAWTRREDGSFGHVERLVRCRVCLAPRCGSVEDRPPCREVRHHRGPHHLGDRFEPIGGVDEP